MESEQVGKVYVCALELFGTHVHQINAKTGPRRAMHAKVAMDYV